MSHWMTFIQGACFGIAALGFILNLNRAAALAIMAAALILSIMGAP